MSSSGHLVILQGLLGVTGPAILFDVMLHVGTLAAILIVFRKDIADLIGAAIGIVSGKRSDKSTERLILAIIVGCVPTAIIGVVFADQFEKMFSSMTAAGVGLLCTGAILMSTIKKGKGDADTDMNSPVSVGLIQALIIGTAQGLAIVPGISRSGTTIAVALLIGVERESAARFSFLLSIPAILGALVFEMRDYLPGAHAGLETAGVGSMFSGAVVAAVTGVIALKLLLSVVRRGRISLFAYYCWAIGLLAILLGVIRG